LIEKSVQLGKKKAEAHQPFEPVLVAETPKHDNKQEEALALITAKHSVEKTKEPQLIVEPEPVKPLHAAQTKHAHHKKHRKQHRHKRRQGHKPTGIKREKEHVESELIQVVEKSNTQLDNLFMTVKNDLLQKPKQKTLL
jgi:hypothetical protein